MESFPATSPYRLLCLLILHSKPRKALSSWCFFGVSLGRVLFRFKSGLKIQEFVLTYLGETWRVLRRLFVDFVLENPIFHFRKTRTMKEGINFKANVDMRRSPGAPVQVHLRRSSMGFRDEEAGSPRGIPWGENVSSFT